MGIREEGPARVKEYAGLLNKLGYSMEALREHAEEAGVGYSALKDSPSRRAS